MKKAIFCFTVIILFFLVIPTSYGALNDNDNDGLIDEEEINIYHTDPNNPDTDSDTYNDGSEIKNGFSPLNPKRIKQIDNDFDHDGLNDAMEILFHTDLSNSDTDNDGYKDAEELDKGFDPTKKDAVLKQELEVSLKEQKLFYIVGGIKYKEFKVSTGKKSTPTPIGTFKIINKHPKAWSSYGLWMPYWLGLGKGKFGIHELPVWPNGYREGEDHLGKPVSHGCIRLGVNNAKYIYDLAKVGMTVKIY
ncbi:MAG: L,D-transpeptidase [Planctomycetes bacterium]|jgi:hypothetical protein|nr:L,D-transpeptidase [Planctomycetota bacterium]